MTNINKQDLLSLEFIYDINSIITLLKNMKDSKNNDAKSKNLIFLSSNSAKLKDNSDMLYDLIRLNMLEKGNNAICYFASRLSKEILFDEILETNKQYYLDLLHIADNIEATKADDNLYFRDKSKLRRYCKVVFLHSKEQFLNSFIYDIKKEYPNAKNLNDILDIIDISTLLELLKALQQKLITNLETLQDSTYFTQNILPVTKNNIQTLFNDLYKNIQKAKDKQWKLKITRALAIVVINIIDFDIDNPFKSGSKKFITLIDSIWNGVSEIIDIIESNQNSMYYAICSSLIQLLISKIAPMTTLYKQQLMNDIFIYDNSFIDFHTYNDSINILPTQYTFIKGSLDSNFIDTLPSILQGKTYTNTKHDYSLISINDKEYNLEKHIEKNIQNLRFLLFAEYTDLNSAKLIEIMKDKATLEQTASSFKEKGYLFITEATNFHNAGLNKEIIESIGLTAHGYEKRDNRKQNSLSKKHQPIIDYSKYTIKQDKSKLQHIVLQLSPFVKLPKEIEYKYRNNLDSYKIIKWTRKKMSRLSKEKYMEIKQLEYIDSFFQLPDDIDEIENNEKNFVQEFLKLTQDFFDTTNKGKIYSTKQSTDEIIEENTQYSLQDIFSIITTLCIIKQEFDISQIYGISSKQKIPKSFMGKIQWFQTYNINNYGLLYILVKHAYITIHNQRIYIVLSQTTQKNSQLDSNSQVLRIDEVVNEILQTEVKEDFYTKAFQILINTANQYSLDETEKKELTTLQTQEKDILNKLVKNTNTQESKMIENQINKFSIQTIIKNGFISLIPFTDYFNENPDFLGKIIHYLAEYIFDKKPNNTSLTKQFIHIIAKELGILAILKVDKTSKIEKEVKIFYRFYKLVVSTRIVYMEQTLSFMQINTTTKSSIKYTLSLLNKLEFKDLLKNITKTALPNVAHNILVSYIKNKFPTYYEEFKTKYEYIVYQKLRYKYNLPYAVNRKEFITIPMKIYNAYMCFDLKSMIYGSKLCTGGLKYHSGIVYSYTPIHNTSNINLSITKHYVLQKLLGYILLDELRGVSKGENYYINDIEFFANGTNKANLDILKNNKELYKLRDEKKLQEFRNLDDSGGIKAIDAYNICIDILSDICNDIMNTNAKSNQHEAKTTILLKHLNIIAQNNIKALYAGINKNKSDSSNKKSWFVSEKQTNTQGSTQDSQQTIPPKLIGRLATTIIIEDGLWIG